MDSIASGSTVELHPAEPALTILQRPASQLGHMLGRERLEHEHPGARQERTVDLEARILGRGADQRDRAVLGGRQEAVLLRLVEPVDLVHEEDGLRPARVEPGPRLAHDLPDARHPFR